MYAGVGGMEEERASPPPHPHPQPKITLYLMQQTSATMYWEAVTTYYMLYHNVSMSMYVPLVSLARFSTDSLETVNHCQAYDETHE